MPAGNHKQLAPADRAHYTAIKAAVLGTFKYWAKPKVNPDYVDKLADEIAMKSVATYRSRCGGGK